MALTLSVKVKDQIYLSYSTYITNEDALLGLWVRKLSTGK